MGGGGQVKASCACTSRLCTPPPLSPSTPASPLPLAFAAAAPGSPPLPLPLPLYSPPATPLRSACAFVETADLPTNLGYGKLGLLVVYGGTSDPLAADPFSLLSDIWWAGGRVGAWAWAGGWVMHTNTFNTWAGGRAGGLVLVWAGWCGRVGKRVGWCGRVVLGGDRSVGASIREWPIRSWPGRAPCIWSHHFVHAVVAHLP